MRGPSILVRALADPLVSDARGRKWQYHSRSDRHSKVACWGVIFDLLAESALFRAHAASGEIAFGINHEMRDFTTNREKRLDLVICTPRGGGASRTASRSFADLTATYGIVLDQAEQELLATLPPLAEAPVGAVRLALEAKAVMTAHIRAIPRLFDELNSSRMTIHAASDVALAAGLVMINTSEEFISSDLNKQGTDIPDVVSTNQPHGPDRVLAKVREIPRRARSGQDGFDALGVVLLSMRNDGGPVRLVDGPANGADIFRYEQMLHRLVQLYEARFR